MNYLLHLHGRYYFNRRVPLDLQEIDPRVYVRSALKTDSKREALQLIGSQNARLESYWKYLIENNLRHHTALWRDFNRPSRLARFLVAGDVTASMPSALSVTSKASIDGITQLVPMNSAKLSNCLEKYWRFEKPKTLNKSDNQIRKWKNPRILAIKNLISCIGDKPVATITREDMLSFREWWMERIAREEVTPSTVNKNLVLAKTILECVSDNLKLELDMRHLFRKILLPDDDQIRRLPFESQYIVDTLLNPENLKGLNEQARWVLHAIAETGAGISEQVGLLPEDIILDHEVPHIVIVPRHKKALKTKYRKRSIPLVGYALEAFKACPDGFTHYRDRPDALSGVLSSYLRENNLLPTPHHTVYSLRHSFQDRLLSVNAPDRVQADLMGHKFNRPSYGDGASLYQKLHWLNKTKLMPQQQIQV